MAFEATFTRLEMMQATARLASPQATAQRTEMLHSSYPMGPQQAAYEVPPPAPAGAPSTSAGSRQVPPPPKPPPPQLGKEQAIPLLSPPTKKARPAALTVAPSTSAGSSQVSPPPQPAPPQPSSLQAIPPSSIWAQSEFVTARLPLQTAMLAAELGDFPGVGVSAMQCNLATRSYTHTFLCYWAT